ncbi:MAG: DNA topoisomerase, partial [Candidatus Nanoarchaeia archaeon]
IYPTGETPKALNSRQKAVYDLIVKRFLAVFGEPAIKETTKMTFEIENEHFHFSGSKIIKEGWRELYKPYVESVEDEVPSLLKGEIVQQKSKLHNKKTTPPKRYSPASIIKELEKRNLGTKATRSQILDTLYQRGYISGTSIEVTSLGLKMVEAFGKYAPDILSERLTRHFEEDMELIRERKKSSAEVFTEARKVLISLLNQFNLHRKQIGEELAIAVTEARKAESVLMKCPKCGKGDFKIIISQKSGKRFLACNKYPSCKTAWPLPQQGLLKIMQQKHTCGTPYIQIIKKGCKPWKLCPNPTCSEKSQQENTCANAKN